MHFWWRMEVTATAAAVLVVVLEERGREREREACQQRYVRACMNADGTHTHRSILH